ncbi:4-hydroxy-3-methylbut-2-enyl diphosphate reductase [Micromonospora sp. NPDC049559]|uniref:4-hydroxy-3-methylbut-2-enyl diphosphate reductase n=1 Tax=Micromonospora sp. NPDC049559 TaxID=3155923 RepID=UPI003416B45D
MSGDWVLFAPMRAEARALRRGLPPGAPLRRTGRGLSRAGRAAAAYRATAALAVAGIGGGLTDRLQPGDVVVATEVRRDAPDAASLPCPGAPLLAAALRRRGHTVHLGPVVSTDRLVDGAERERLAATGALAVDTESAALLAGAGRRPVACVRAVADVPPGPLYRPATLARVATALRTLRSVGPALVDWAAATTVRGVLLAAPRSFCAGVERAIGVVEQALHRHGPPVYVRKQIVHNVHVIADLQRRGAVFVDELDEIPDGAVTVFSAHGVAPAVRDTAARRGLPLIDATCPLVAKVHSEARRFVGRGNTVLLIGHAGHEETEGTLGEAPGRITLVESAQDAERIEVADPERVSYLVQTTLAVDEVSGVLDVLRRRFPALTGPSSDDICYATTNRQVALREVAARADVVLVLGSANSSNSRRLAEVSERDGTPAYLVDDVEAVDPRWLAGARTVGVTAGASAPPWLVERAVEALRGLGARTVREHTTSTEDVHFTLPKEVRT